jgi:hypothetical protein
MNYVSLSIYPAEICVCPEAIKSVWFQYLLLDEACKWIHPRLPRHGAESGSHCKSYGLDYHCLVALSEACIDFLVGTERYSHEFTYHMCLGLRLINEKLSSSQALSDTSIATVISLCLIYSIRQLPMQVIVHFEGLCRLIELRGGLDQLHDNPTLVEKARR